MNKITTTHHQTQALVSLLHTLDATGATLDIHQAVSGEPIRVAVWKLGEPTPYFIDPDGYTREANS